MGKIEGARTELVSFEAASFTWLIIITRKESASRTSKN